MDGVIPAQKQFQDPQEENGGYEALRTTHPLPLSSANKLLPLGKKENGFLYCLSPSDPPVPLRPVPSPRRGFPDKTNCDKNKLTTTPEVQRRGGGEGRQRPTNFGFGVPSALQESKSSPIYELPDRFLKVGPNLKRRACSPPPALPERVNHQMRANAENESPTASLQLPTVHTNHSEPAVPYEDPTPYHTIDLKAKKPPKTEAGKEDDGLGMEMREVVTGGQSEGEMAPAPEELQALYANVKKHPKSKPSTEEHLMSVSESITPPELPPYLGERWVEGGMVGESEGELPPYLGERWVEGGMVGESEGELPPYLGERWVEGGMVGESEGELPPYLGERWVEGGMVGGSEGEVEDKESVCPPSTPFIH